MAQNISGMIANAVDNESMAILAQPSNSTQTTSDFNTSLENTIVNCLAANIPASVLSSDSSSPLVLQVADNYTITPISYDDRSSFDIQTTQDVSDISFSLMSQYDSTVQPAPDSYSSDIGTLQLPVTKSNAIIIPSASIYDSNVAFNYLNNEDVCYSTSDNANSAYPTDLTGTIPSKGTWEASFDTTNTNVNYSRAVNSLYNTTNYSNPMTVDENTIFNQTYALGNDLITSNQQHYFTVDSNGKPIENDIDTYDASSQQGYMEPTFVISNNGIVAAKDVNFNITLDDCGSYRFHQFFDNPLITFIEEQNINNSTNQSDVSNFPVFNGNAPESLITNTISTDKFYSLFNRDYSTENNETIMAEYKYTVTIQEESGSGYYINSTDNTERTVTNTFTLDDSELLDNAVYMEHYVNGIHTLTFSEGGLNIVSADSDASPDNIANAFSLNTEREYITNSNFANGQIKINNNSPTTRTEEQLNSLNLNQKVFYSSEDVNYDSISQELQENASVAYLAQLVVKNSKDIDSSFMKNTGNRAGEFALDLYTNSIVNSNFNQSDFGFTAPNSSDVQAEVFKITPLKQLSSINGFNSMSNNVGTQMPGVATSANLTSLATELIGVDNVYDKAKMVFALRNLADHKISNIVSNAPGWSITSTSGSKMASSSQIAFSSGAAAFPDQDDTMSLIKGEIPEIDLRISINTITTGYNDSSSSSAHLIDSVLIEWSTDNFVGDISSISLGEGLITRTQTNHILSPINHSTKVTKPFNLISKLSGKNVSVHRQTVRRDMTVTFDLPMRPFNGLELKSPPITVITSSHVIIDNITGQQYPKSLLKYISDTDTNEDTRIDYSKTTEIFSHIQEFNGKLTSNDFCDMFVTVVKQDTDGGESVALSDTKPISSMYGINTSIDLYDSNQAEVSLEVSYVNELGDESNVVFDNTQGYELQLTGDYDANYTCEHWTANTDNIKLSTNIQGVEDTTDFSNKVLTVSNGYNNINTESWNSTDYEVVVSYEEADNSTNVLSIRQKNTTISLFEIRTKNFTYLNTTTFISNVPKDIFRKDRWIGQKGSDAQIHFTEQFIQVDYTYTNGEENTQSNIFSLDTGVYLTASNLDSTTFTKSDIGKLIKFSLLTDSIGVNMINSVNNLYPITYNNNSSEANHTISNYGLTFQYVIDNNNSRKFSIDRYRAFYGSGNQVYTITRDVMVATLAISKSSNNESYPGLISQNWNVYKDEEYTVDNLSNNSVSFGGVGLKIKFLFSMLSDDDTTNFYIFTQGDAVNFTIDNPNTQMPYKLAPSSTDLSSFILDTFSGSNYNNSGKSYSINSKRLKIKTTNPSNPFNFSTASWSIELQPGVFKIYKNNNYLGNPANLDTNDAYSPPNPSLWTDTTPTGITYSSKTLITSGVSIAKWMFTRADFNYNPSISFAVLLPPTLLFNQVYSDNKTLPYVLNSQTDLRVSYLPVSSTNTYNPFVASRTYNYIAPTNSVSSVTVSFDQNLANNVTFEQTVPDNLSSYIENERNVPTQHIVVEGNILTMELNAGLKNQDGFTIGTLFESLPANRIMYLNNNTSNFYIKELIDSNSGIQLLLHQPSPNSNTPYDLSTSEIYSTGATINANITLQIDSFFSQNAFSLNLQTGAGTKVNLYTREMVQNNNDFKVYIYKYSSINNVDYNNVDNNGISDANNLAISLTFLQRSYKEIDINTNDFIVFVKTLSRENIKTAFEEYIKIRAQELESNLSAQQWILDTTWPTSDSSDIYNSVYASLVCYSTEALKSIVPKVFSTTFDGKSKAFYVSKHPILSSFDKLGRTTFQITHAGTMILPTVSTGTTIFNASSNSAPNSSLENINVNHTSSNKKSNMSL